MDNLGTYSKEMPQFFVSTFRNRYNGLGGLCVKDFKYFFSPLRSKVKMWHRAPDGEFVQDTGFTNLQSSVNPMKHSSADRLSEENVIRLRVY